MLVVKQQLCSNFLSNIMLEKFLLKNKKILFVLGEFIATVFVITLAAHPLATALLQSHWKD